MNDLIQCKDNKFLFFRNERARYWGENTVDEEDRNFVEWFSKTMEPGMRYLIFHPHDDSSQGNVPDDFDGLVYQYPMTKEMKQKTRAN